MIADVLDVEQGSDEWLSLRAGLLTGSRAPDMLATTKAGKPSASRGHLAFQIACERVVGRCLDNGYQSPAMRRGSALEAEALGRYEAATGNLIRRVGFLRHPELPTGCSPDALVEENGVVEVKCPESLTHFNYLTSPTTVPSDYLAQVLHNLWISGAAWCDFVSYDPRLPAPLQVLIVRYLSTPVEMAAYEFQVRRFLDDVERQEASIRALMVAA